MFLFLTVLLYPLNVEYGVDTLTVDFYKNICVRCVHVMRKILLITDSRSKMSTTVPLELDENSKKTQEWQKRELAIIEGQEWLTRHDLQEIDANNIKDWPPC